MIARAAAHTGYSLILLGERFCSAVINIGPDTPVELFALAEERFTTALDAATSAGRVRGIRFGISHSSVAPVRASTAAGAAADAAAIQAQVREERRRDLSLESHRLVDTILFTFLSCRCRGRHSRITASFPA